MRCRICDGEIVQRYTSNYGFSVSSENRILDQNIEVYECLHCRHIQKFASPQVLDLIYQTYQSDSILPHMEQVKLELGESKSCSQAVLDHTRMYLAHSSQLAMLDYGAGGGGYA